MIDKISAAGGVYDSSGSESDAYLAWMKELDQKQTEAVRYYKEIGKTPEDVRREKGEVRLLGREAFQEYLKRAQRRIKK